MTDAAAALTRHDVALVRADNPGPLTLTGTNTWLVGRDPCWIVDPGPALDAHVDAVLAEATRRGGVGGIALTHDHGDHSGAVAAVLERSGGGAAARRERRSAAAPVRERGGGAAAAPRVGAARGDVDLLLRDGDTFGPLRVVATPGHAPDHLAFVAGAVCFTGDAVLAQSSVFVAPDPGALRGYLAALARLRAMALELLCTGHGPPVTDPDALLDRYLAHRGDRERRLVAALADGLRTIDELLDRVWDDAPAHLRLPAAATLAAHLDKLDEEGRLPEGVQRPPWPPEGGLRLVV